MELWTVLCITVQTVLSVSHLLMMYPVYFNMACNIISIYGNYTFYRDQPRNPFYWASLINYESRLFLHLDPMEAGFNLFLIACLMLFLS